MEWSEFSKVGLLADEGVQAFEKVFTDWFGHLYAYAMSVVKDEETAEEVVQKVFCRIWEKRERLEVHTSLKAYLYGCVYHECVNWMRREKRRRDYRSGVMGRLGSEAGKSPDNAFDRVEARELEQRLQRALDELPEQCRAIFELSRFSGLKYREIADQLGISVKTVEAQMGKALKLLRCKLADYFKS